MSSYIENLQKRRKKKPFHFKHNQHFFWSRLITRSELTVIPIRLCFRTQLRVQSSLISIPRSPTPLACVHDLPHSISVSLFHSSAQRSFCEILWSYNIVSRDHASHVKIVSFFFLLQIKILRP